MLRESIEMPADGREGAEGTIRWWAPYTLGIQLYSHDYHKSANLDVPLDRLSRLGLVGGSHRIANGVLLEACVNQVLHSRFSDVMMDWTDRRYPAVSKLD